MSAQPPVPQPAPAVGADSSGREILVVTGMSGAGRSTTAKVLEDLGWYVIDNLPPQMLTDLLERWDAATTAGRTNAPLAVVVDVRTREISDAFHDVLAEFARHDRRATLLFLNANDETLVRRFESVRRPHPLQGAGRVLDGLERERLLLADLLSQADLVIDTSHLNVHQLAGRVASAYGGEPTHRLRLGVMSFGFKYGVPLDADFVLDVRFLPNPYWVPELRLLTGRDVEVASYVFGQPGAEPFVGQADALMQTVMGGAIREGRRFLTLAIGCTGGKHRSVAMAERLAHDLSRGEVVTYLVHRDLGRE